MKVILSKEEFVKHLTKYMEECDMVMKLYHEYSIDIIDCDWAWATNHFIDLLSKMMHDEDDKIYGTILSWWCWETDFGRNAEMNRVYDENGEIYKVLDTPEAVYDYLVEVNDGRDDIE